MQHKIIAYKLLDAKLH